jgi:pectate lyase
VGEQPEKGPPTHVGGYNVGSYKVQAFPGAEGFGAATAGGRRGRVIAVTNLDDSGAGSLRAAIEAKGPRIVVFHVAGTIALQSPLVASEPWLTVAGQTAPGGGIALKDHAFILGEGMHDAVIRHLRVRPGLGGGDEPDGIGLYGGDRGPVRNVVVDHCSISWAVDENIGMGGGCEDISIQWCIVAEGSMEGHHKGPHSMGILCGGENQCQRVSIHHNLFAHNNQRNPRIQGGRVDFINNVVYNWGGIAGQFTWAPHTNFIGNFYKPGPSSNRARHAIETDGAFPLYVAGNIGLRRPEGKGDEWAIVGNWDKPADRSNRRAEPWPGAAIPVTIDSAEDAYEQVLDRAGATLPERDGVDRRIVNEVRTGEGGLGIRGAYPNLDGIAPADDDGDGMPNDWERDFGFDPLDKWDGIGDADNDGYTNVEEYLNATDPREER